MTTWLEEVLRSLSGQWARSADYKGLRAVKGPTHPSLLYYSPKHPRPPAWLPPTGERSTDRWRDRMGTGGGNLGNGSTWSRRLEPRLGVEGGGWVQAPRQATQCGSGGSVGKTTRRRQRHYTLGLHRGSGRGRSYSDIRGVCPHGPTTRAQAPHSGHFSTVTRVLTPLGNHYHHWPVALFWKRTDKKRNRHLPFTEIWTEGKKATAEIITAKRAVSVLMTKSLFSACHFLNFWPEHVVSYSQTFGPILLFNWIYLQPEMHTFKKPTSKLRGRTATATF